MRFLVMTGPLPAVLAAFVMLAAVSLPTGPVRAEHEVYYRYVVLGYVKDARGQPIASRPVELVRDKTGFSYLTESDPGGFFLLIARLGDESVGERLTLRVGDTTTGLVARFDPANHADERGTRIDLEGRRFIERPAAFRSTLTNFLGAPVR